jgi:hypothetical protein
MGEIGHYNYAGYELKDKYAWFQSGPGAAAAVQVSGSLKRIAARLDVSDGTIGAGFIERRLGTDWEGGAAQAASGAFDRAAVVLTSLTTSSLSGGGSAQRFGDSFGATKKAVAPPQTQNWLSNAVGDDLAGAVDGFWEAQSDGRATDVANRNADLAANEALQSHENTAREVLAGYRSAAAAAQPPAPTPAGTAQAKTVSAGAASVPGPRGAGPGATGRGSPASGSAVKAGGTSGGTSQGGTGKGGTANGDAAGGAGGTSSAGAGAGSHGGTAGSGSAGGGAGNAGWTAGMVPAPNGGYVSPGNAYRLTPETPWQPPSGRTPGYAGGYRGTPVDQPLSRAGSPSDQPPRIAGPDLLRGGPGAGSGASGGRGPGQGGMAPMGMGAAGAGGRERDHRNQFYIPEDEPFRVEFDFYVSPPVIGADPSGGNNA